MLLLANITIFLKSFGLLRCLFSSNINQNSLCGYTMHSNVDPRVRLLACVDSHTAARSWPKAALNSSLNFLLPCQPVDQPRSRTVGSAQHIVSEAVQLCTPLDGARWLDVSYCFEVKYLLNIVNLNVNLIRNNFDMPLLPI